MLRENLCNRLLLLGYRYVRLSIDTYFFDQYVQINRYNWLLAEQ